MTKHMYRFLIQVLFTIGFTTVAHAQNTLSQWQTQLVSPWVVTVEGEARLRSLRILGVGQKTQETFLVDATYGWIDGEQVQVRAEVSEVSNQRRLQLTTPAATIIVATQSPDGSFTGTFTPKKGAAKTVKLEQVSEQQMQIRTAAASVAREAQLFSNEDTDWGIDPTSALRTSQYHAPTPRTIPGGQIIKTMELRNLLDGEKAVVAIDVLGSKERTTVPGAYWMPGAGSGQFSNAEKGRFLTALEKLTAGDRRRPLVFLCINSECWLSYNASLHAIDAGYMNVIWYRGGTDAWGAAGLPSRKPEQVNW